MIANVNENPEILEKNTVSASKNLVNQYKKDEIQMHNGLLRKRTHLYAR